MKLFRSFFLYSKHTFRDNVNRPGLGGCMSVLYYTCAKPPSTHNSIPVMELLSSDARNTTALAISLAVPGLPSGILSDIMFKRCSPGLPSRILSDIMFKRCSPAALPCHAGVSINPGLTAFTRMRRSFKSVVHVRANERTAAFVALYTLLSGKPFLATMDAFRMIEAPSGISGSAF